VEIENIKIINYNPHWMSKQPLRFQSYLVVAPTAKLAREQTGKLASRLGINLEKISPDVSMIKALKKEISIEQIREIKGHVFQKPLEYRYKFIVIENAQNITTEGQNSLLKLLEEPPDHAIIVLESKNKAQLLPTIISRTAQIPTDTRQEPNRPKLLLNMDIQTAFDTLATAENKTEFLDDQIINITGLMENKAKGRRVNHTYSQLAEAIENCAYAKNLINSNVSPAFALANLVFSLKFALENPLFKKP
jgi:hypothetical protein